MASDWRDDARRRLLGLRRRPGSWGYRPGTAPASEPTGLAGLALLATGEGDDRPGHGAASDAGRWLGSARRGDGSLGVTTSLPEPGWATPTALLLWSALGGFEAERSAATRWLLAARGRPIAREAGDPMGHDTTLVGWPWVAETHSWVEPTATALLALAREGQAGHARSLEGVRVLRDRAIPGGGWNLGNPVVFGTTLRPLPGPTGLALLALASVPRGPGPRPSPPHPSPLPKGGREQDWSLAPSGPLPHPEGGLGWGASSDHRRSSIDAKLVKPALAYLRSALETTLAPVSLGWGLLGLRAWGESPPWAADRTASAFARLASRTPSAVELAMLLLAAGPRSLEALGIAAFHDGEAGDA